jgi:hypothetical protein
MATINSAYSGNSRWIMWCLVTLFTPFVAASISIPLALLAWYLSSDQFLMGGGHDPVSVPGGIAALMIALLIPGLLMGFLQLTSLQGTDVKGREWVLATMFGMAVLLIAFAAPAEVHLERTLEFFLTQTLVAVVGGAVLGVAQWVPLRKYSRARFWPFANVIGAGLFALPFVFAGVWVDGTVAIAACLCVFLIYVMATGALLVWILELPPQAQQAQAATPGGMSTRYA